MISSINTLKFQKKEDAIKASCLLMFLIEKFDNMFVYGFVDNKDNSCKIYYSEEEFEETDLKQLYNYTLIEDMLIFGQDIFFNINGFLGAKNDTMLH